MKRWLTIALSGLVLSCQGPAAVLAQTPAAMAAPGDGCVTHLGDPCLRAVVAPTAGPTADAEKIP
jgi:hypothetical protein